MSATATHVERAVDVPSLRPAASGLAALRERAAARGLLFGATAYSAALADDAPFAARFAEECGVLTPEFELRWGTLRPAPDAFDWSGGDWLLAFARRHRMRFRGHALVWHEDLPPWFGGEVDAGSARRVMQTHIRTVAEHYAGAIHSWDVVADAVEPAHGRSDGLRDTSWLRWMGAAYIDLAFDAARDADPRAMLVLSEYGLDYDTPEDDARRDATLRLLDRLVSARVPVHALGVQAHLRADERRFDPRKLAAFLRQVAGLGLRIMVTEMDVCDQRVPADVRSRDRAVAAAYGDYLAVVLDEPAVVAVVTRGLSDRYTWLSRCTPRHDGAPVRPLPLDADGEEKLAWAAIARALDDAPPRRAGG